MPEEMIGVGALGGIAGRGRTFIPACGAAMVDRRILLRTLENGATAQDGSKENLGMLRLRLHGIIVRDTHSDRRTLGIPRQKIDRNACVPLQRGFNHETLGPAV